MLPSSKVIDQEKEVFDRVHQEIVDRRLYLDPFFSRSKYIKLGLVNKNKVARIMQRYAGTNLNGYINALRLDYALEMLHDFPAAPIKAIASVSGFNSVRTFYRLFAEKYGMSPQEYKAKVWNYK